jgi:hypothetical protein
MELGRSYFTAIVTPVGLEMAPTVTTTGSAAPGVTPGGTITLAWKTPETKPGGDSTALKLINYAGG